MSRLRHATSAIPGSGMPRALAGWRGAWQYAGAHVAHSHSRRAAPCRWRAAHERRRLSGEAQGPPCSIRAADTGATHPVGGAASTPRRRVPRALGLAGSGDEAPSGDEAARRGIIEYAPLG